jgi:hypothetical protein
VEHQPEVRVRGLSEHADDSHLEMKLIDMCIDSSQVLCLGGATGVPRWSSRTRPASELDRRSDQLVSNHRATLAGYGTGNPLTRQFDQRNEPT